MSYSSSSSSSSSVSESKSQQQYKRMRIVDGEEAKTVYVRELKEEEKKALEETKAAKMTLCEIDWRDDDTKCQHGELRRLCDISPCQHGGIRIGARHDVFRGQVTVLEDDLIRPGSRALVCGSKCKSRFDPADVPKGCAFVCSCARDEPHFVCQRPECRFFCGRCSAVLCDDYDLCDICGARLCRDCKGACQWPASTDRWAHEEGTSICSDCLRTVYPHMPGNSPIQLCFHHDPTSTESVSVTEERTRIAKKRSEEHQTKTREEYAKKLKEHKQKVEKQLQLRASLKRKLGDEDV